jgi:hypothetical protein
MLRHVVAVLLAGCLLNSSSLCAGDGDQPKRVEGEKAETFAKLFDAALTKSAKAVPVKVVPDFKRALGLGARDRVGFVVPDAKLSADSLRKIDRQIVPVGVLYLHRVTIVPGDDPVSADQHRTIEVTHDGKTVTVSVLHLAATKVAGRLVILIYTNSDTPLVVSSLTDAKEASDFPIDLDVRPAVNDRATLVLKIAGAYRTFLTLAAQD